MEFQTDSHINSIGDLPTELMLKNFEKTDVLTLLELRKTSKQFKTIADEIINQRYFNKKGITYNDVKNIPMAEKIQCLMEYGHDYSFAPKAPHLSRKVNTERSLIILKTIVWGGSSTSNYFDNSIIDIGQPHAHDYDFEANPVNLKYLSDTVDKINIYVGNKDLLWKSLYLFFSAQTYDTNNQRYEKLKTYCLSKIVNKNEITNDASGTHTTINRILLDNPVFNYFFKFNDRHNITYNDIIRNKMWNDFITNEAYIGKIDDYLENVTLTDLKHYITFGNRFL